MSAKPLPKTANERSDATRRRLIEAGIDLFGMHGFEGTTTRALADAAGANLAAIPYHFGGKDALYRAVAEAVVEGLSSRMGGLLEGVEREMEAGVGSPDQAIVLVERLMVGFSDIILMNPDADRWVSFLLREKADPTEAFVILYDNPIRHMRSLMAKLLTKVSGLEVDHPRVKLMTIELLGLVYVFRTSRASALREMGWHGIDIRTYPEIRKIILENTHLILKGMLEGRAGPKA